jgi:hypothetical protein
MHKPNYKAKEKKEIDNENNSDEEFIDYEVSSDPEAIRDYERKLLIKKNKDEKNDEIIQVEEVSKHPNHPHHTKHAGHSIHNKDNKQDENLLLGKNHLKESDDKIKKDPLKLYDNHVSEDYYALVWCSLKGEIWNEKSFYGVDINLTSSNIKQMFIEFIVFILLLLSTVLILIIETISELKFTIANYRIEILRILLIFFAQKLLSPEFAKGSQKFRYAINFPEEFTYPNFAIFVSFCQMAMSCINYICIVMFMCLSDSALPLVMHFAEVAVLIELDDWIGEMICKEFPDEGEKPDDVDTEGINENMSLYSKLALVREDLRIVNDFNIVSSNFIIRFFSFISTYFPWFILPFVSTMILEYFLIHFQPALIESS